MRFDPALLPYDHVLAWFWRLHDPTTPNRQGNDVGTQYRSVIFHHGPDQEAAARASLETIEASGRFKRPIATEIAPASAFWRAEEYHQRYIAKGGKAACAINTPSTRLRGSGGRRANPRIRIPWAP